MTEATTNKAYDNEFDKYRITKDCLKFEKYDNAKFRGPISVMAIETLVEINNLNYFYADFNLVEEIINNFKLGKNELSIEVSDVCWLFQAEKNCILEYRSIHTHLRPIVVEYNEISSDSGIFVVLNTEMLHYNVSNAKRDSVEENALIEKFKETVRGKILKINGGPLTRIILEKDKITFADSSATCGAFKAVFALNSETIITDEDIIYSDWNGNVFPGSCRITENNVSQKYDEYLLNLQKHES